MKRLSVFFLLLLLILSACGNDQSESAANADENDPIAEKESENNDKTLSEPGQTIEEDEYTVELIKAKEVNQEVDLSPLNVLIEEVKVIKYRDMKDSFKEYVETYSPSTIEDEAFYIQLTYTAENTEDKNIQWAGLRNIVTDQKEQIDALALTDFLIDDADTDQDFYGEVIKNFTDAYIIENGDINSIKLIFTGVDDAETYETLSESTEIEIEL